MVDDRLGTIERVPRFVRRFDDLAVRIEAAAYAQAVRERSFPGDDELYGAKPAVKPARPKALRGPAAIAMVRAAWTETDLAKTDDRDEAFLREVDDEYRRAQLGDLWSKYGRVLAIGLVAVLVVLGALLYWREERARRAGIVGEDFAQALTKLEAGNFAGAAPVLDDLAKNGNPGYQALARLMQAGTAVQAGDVPRGLAIYQGVAADAALARPFRDLATIKATRLAFETLPPATVVERLKALAVPGDPWFPVAAEMTGIAQLRAGKPQLAGALFAAIVRDTSAPPSLRNRAAQLAVSLGVDPATLAPARTLTASGTDQ